MAKGLTLDIELIGVDKARKSMTPDMYLDIISAEIKRIAVRAQGTARKGFDSRSPVISSLKIETKPLQGRMFTEMTDNRTRSIEVGRDPGEALLHPNALRSWARREGATTAIFEIARSIQKRGVKGRFFMQAALSEAERRLGSGMDGVAKLVASKFPRFK